MPRSSVNTQGALGPWVDTHGVEWLVALQADKVTLCSNKDCFELPAENWQRDIQLTAHMTGYVVRFDTFDRTIGFILTKKQAAPLTELVGGEVERARSAAEEVAAQAVRTAPLQWPKISPLAVWALICAALVFVPLVGELLILPTLVLLVLHRIRVRRTRAYSHSRAICLAALVFLLLGAYTCFVSSWVALCNFGVLNYDEHSDAMPPTPVHPEAGVQSTEAIHVCAGPSTALLADFDSFFQEHNWGMIGAGLAAILLALCIHECAHAITAWWHGDNFAQQMGRVTLNPLAHIDPVGTVVVPFFLFITGLPGFGWARPVPVQIHELDHPRRDDILVSIAGPGSNLLQAAAALMLLLALGSTVSLVAPGAQVSNFYDAWGFDLAVEASGFLLAPVFAAACTFLKLCLILNIFLAAFNLIPVPPLDGSWVLEHLFPFSIGRLIARIRPWGFLILLGLIYTGLLDYFFIPIFYAVGFLYGIMDLCTFF